MSSKFDGAVAEAACEIAGHGFAEECGSVDEPGGWNALVDVSASTLQNVGADPDLVERFRAEVPGVAGALVWVRADGQGRVMLVMHGTDEGPRSGTDAVIRAWDAWVDDDDDDEN